MRLVSAMICVMALGAAPTIAPADELTAEQVVDRMVKANLAWLKPDIADLSYTVKAADGNTMTVYYRAPDHLRAESAPDGRMVLLPGGRGFASGETVRAAEWGGDAMRDWAVAGVVFRGAAWGLANHGIDCVTWDFERQRVDGRDAYHLAVSGFLVPVFGVTDDFPPPLTVPRHELWIDAETFRPLREAWHDVGAQPSPLTATKGSILRADTPPRRVIRYRDYQPLPGGGQAPMLLEDWNPWPTADFATDPPGPPDAVSHYRMVDGQLWCRQDTFDARGEVIGEVADLSIQPAPMQVFYDNERLRVLERLTGLCQQIARLRDGRLWREALDTCEQVLALGSTACGAGATAFDLHFWHGDYRRVIELSEKVGDCDQLFLAWAHDAVGDRDKALEIYRKLSEPGAATAGWPEVEQGLERPWVSVTDRIQPRADERLLAPDETWQVSAQPEGLTQRDAIDGDRGTRWISTTAQHRGMWFRVDLGRKTVLSRVVFDFAGDLTLDYHDYPRKYVVEVSTDGDNWETVEEGRGLRDNLVEAELEPEPVQFLRIRQEGTEWRYCWSIREIFFLAPK